MKKLKLNKETISFLNRNQMKNVNGGGASIEPWCFDNTTYTSDAACPPSDNCNSKTVPTCYSCGTLPSGCICDTLNTKFFCETENCLTDPTTGSIANPGASGGIWC